MIFVRYPEVFCNHEPDFKKPIRISSSDLGRFVALTHNQNLFRLCWLFRRGCKVPSQTAEARLVCNRHALQTDELPPIRSRNWRFSSMPLKRRS